MRRPIVLECAAVAFAALWASATATLLGMLAHNTFSEMPWSFVFAIGGLAGVATGFAAWRVRRIRGEQGHVAGITVVAMLGFSVLVGLGFAGSLFLESSHLGLVRASMVVMVLVAVSTFAFFISLIPAVLGAILFGAIVALIARLRVRSSEPALRELAP